MSAGVLDGLSTVLENLNGMLEGLGASSIKGLEAAALHIGAESAKMAPVLTGNLRGSMTVTAGGAKVATGTPQGGVAIIGAANLAGPWRATIGFDTPYAVKQHEHVEYFHPLGGQAKYLEEAVKANADKIVEVVGDYIRRGL